MKDMIQEIANAIATSQERQANWVIVDPEFREINLKRGFSKATVLRIAKFIRKNIGAKKYNQIWYRNGKPKPIKLRR
jgi:hypothetical protein